MQSFDHVVLQGQVANRSPHISITRLSMATKLGRMIAFLDGLLPIMSHDPLITWSCELRGSLTGGGSPCKRLSRHRLLVIMDGCKKCCEINTVSFTCGLLQVLPRKNGWLEVMSSYNNFFQYMRAWNQGGIIIIASISLLQFLFWKNTVNLKEWAVQLLFCNGNSSNGWLQLDLILMKLTQYLWKKEDWKCLFERNTVP